MVKIEGAIAVKAAILNKKRHIDAVYIRKDKKTKDFSYLKKIITDAQIPLFFCTKEELDDLSAEGKHGGIIAFAGERIFEELDDGDIFYLDGIEDPFNLGYCFRTLYALGVKNVLLGNRDLSNMEGQLLKSSAGAYDMLKISKKEDIVSEISCLKEDGYTVFSLYRGEGSRDIYDVCFPSRSLFLIGGEKRGVSSALLSLSDAYLYIPYGNDFRNSLNAAAALDVTATLLFGQRK